MKKPKQKTRRKNEMQELAKAWVLLFLEQKGYIHLLGKTKNVVKSSIDINSLCKLNLKTNEKKG
jgi:hypothetical protein